MPSGKRDRRWLRPISELKGGEPPSPELEAFTQPEPQAPTPPTPPTPPTQVSQPPTQVSQPPTQVSQPPTKVSPTPPMQYLDGGNMDVLSVIINTLNTNPYFIGLVMLLLNLGGRFLSMELSKKQEEFLQQRWLRPLIFFTVIFVATRNLAVAFWMTLGLFLVLWILANEKSPFCIIPSWREHSNVADSQKQYEKNMQVIQAIESSKTA